MLEFNLLDTLNICLIICLNIIVVVLNNNLIIAYLIYELSVLTYVPIFLVSVRTVKAYWAVLVLYFCTVIGFLCFTLLLIFDYCFYVSTLKLEIAYIKVILVVCLLIIIFIKVPSFPTFFWLPEAHVEITWIWSVILATIILKYSLLFVQLFCSSLDFCVCILINVVLFMCTIAVILMLMFIVVDIKIFGAYLSIFHMNGGLVAIIFSSCEALISVDFVWVSHSVSALWYFFCYAVYFIRI